MQGADGSFTEFGSQGPCAKGKPGCRKGACGLPQLLWQRCEREGKPGSHEVSPKSQELRYAGAQSRRSKAAQTQCLACMSAHRAVRTR